MLMACRDVDNRLFVAAFHECARDFHHIHFVVTAVCPIPFVDERRVGEVFRFQVVCIQFFCPQASGVPVQKATHFPSSTGTGTSPLSTVLLTFRPDCEPQKLYILRASAELPRKERVMKPHFSENSKV